jgi:hypothetical protein
VKVGSWKQLAAPGAGAGAGAGSHREGPRGRAGLYGFFGVPLEIGKLGARCKE